MQTSARNRGAPMRRPLLASMMAMALLLSFPGIAKADAEYTHGGTSYIYTCPPSDDLDYTCDEGRAYGAEAWITAEDGGGTYPAARVEFHPYGEHVYVHDNYTNTRYAWAHVQRQPSPSSEWLDYQIRSSYYTDQNFDWPDEQLVKIRACEGTYSDYDAFGCSFWKWGRS